MKTVTMIQTHDGAIHDSVKAATKYLEKQYGDLLLKHARALTKDMRYTATSEYLDSNLQDFVTLAKIKADMAMEIEENEDE